MAEADGAGGQVKGWSMLHAHEGECPISRQGKPLTQGSGGAVPVPAWFLVTGALRGVAQSQAGAEGSVPLFSEVGRTRDL